LAEPVGHSLAGKRPTGAFSGSARLKKGLRESFSSPTGREFLLIVEDAGAQIAFTGIGQHNHDGFALEFGLFCQLQCSTDSCARRDTDQDALDRKSVV